MNFSAKTASKMKNCDVDYRMKFNLKSTCDNLWDEIYFLQQDPRGYLKFQGIGGISNIQLTEYKEEANRWTIDPLLKDTEIEHIAILNGSSDFYYHPIGLKTWESKLTCGSGLFKTVNSKQLFNFNNVSFTFFIADELLEIFCYMNQY